ncbi:MAG: helix-turn-helix domain-containing protein [Acidimicrobiia bacterium]
MAEPQLTPDEFNSVVSAVTNAFGDPTRREIYLFARDAGDGGVTASAVAERFDLHPNVARHHLESSRAAGTSSSRSPGRRPTAARTRSARRSTTGRGRSTPRSRCR